MFQVLLRGREPNAHYLLTRFVYIFILPLMLFDGIICFAFFFLFLFERTKQVFAICTANEPTYSFWVIMQQIHLDPLCIEKKPSLIF